MSSLSRCTSRNASLGRGRTPILGLLALLALAACGGSPETEQLVARDGGQPFRGVPPEGLPDALARFDAPLQFFDAGQGGHDAAVSPPLDAGLPTPDAAMGHDSGVRDTGVREGGGRDTGLPRDARADAPRDARGDSARDSGRDVALDAPRDVRVDSRVDARVDSGFDAGVDSGVDGEALDGAVDSAVDAGADTGLPDAGWTIAAHYPMPQVLDFGGPVIDAPVLTAVTFPGYDLTSEAQSFLATVGTIPYWEQAVGEYGVGVPSAGTPVLLSETAPTTIDDTAIQTWLAAKLDGSNPAFGTPSDESIYVIYYPTGTTVTLDGISSCVQGGFGGYHNSVALSSGPWAGQNVSYAVLPECSIEASTQVSLTESGSHELIEATTDPLPQTQDPTYLQVDQADIVWELVLGGGELADMCAQNVNAFFQPAGYPYEVQRIWSNASAAAGHDPCQPSVSGVAYFNATAQLDAQVVLTYQGQAIQTNGLAIPVNGSKTVPISLFSDGPMGDWTLSASDLSQGSGGGPYLSFAWDSTTGNNGSTLNLTITVLATNPTYGGEPFVLFSQSSSGAYNYWIGFVGQ